VEVLSDGFSEGQTRDINRGFPSDSRPYTDDYDYLSDSDLEDEPFCREEEDEDPSEVDDPKPSRGSELRVPLILPSEDLPRPAADVTEVQNDDKSAPMPIEPSNISDQLVPQARRPSNKNGENCHHPRHGSGNVCEVYR